MSLYDELGIVPAINASGRMTALGGSTLDSAVRDAMSEAARSYVVMDELFDAAGRVIAEATGAENGCPTNGAAAGIAISVASTIAGTDRGALEQLPETVYRPYEVVLPKGHAVNFGAPITQMIRIGGGKPVEAGSANLATGTHIRSAITDRTAALVYVQSHHSVQKGMVGLEEFIDCAKERNVPVIVDAAAEQDLRYPLDAGADLVIYSGGKAIGGPASGFICGSSPLIAACRAQYQGIGRSMKVGKEALAGLIAALHRYPRTNGRDRQEPRMRDMAEQLAALPGITARVVSDEAGRNIHRANLVVDPSVAGLNARELADELSRGTPPVFTRDHRAETNVLAIDPRPLDEEQDKIVVRRISEIVRERTSAAWHAGK